VTSSEAIEKAKQYASQKFAAAVDEITQEGQEKLVRARADMAARGLANSGMMAQADANHRAERLKKLMQARADSLIDGFELYDVPITDDLRDLIIREVTQMHEAAVSSAANAPTPGMVGGGMVAATIIRAVGVPVSAIRCQIEERRVNPKMRPKPQSITNVYHVSGDNSRVNVESIDKSVNAVVTSSEQVFQAMRESIRSGVPAQEQAPILERLDALEKAQNQQSFGQHYPEFIAVAANHLTLLAPFIPALAEMLKKALAG